VATSSGAKTSESEEAFVTCDDDAPHVFGLLNSGIHPPSANPDQRSGRNIFISGKLQRLETISSS